MTEQNLVTRLTWDAIDTAVTDACRWTSPYFAHGRVKVALRDLLGKIDRLRTEQLHILAGDLEVPDDRQAIADRVTELAQAQVNHRLQARTALLQGLNLLQADRVDTKEA